MEPAREFFNVRDGRPQFKPVYLADRMQWAVEMKMFRYRDGVKYEVPLLFSMSNFQSGTSELRSKCTKAMADSFCRAMNAIDVLIDPEPGEMDNRNPLDVAMKMDRIAAAINALSAGKDWPEKEKKCAGTDVESAIEDILSRFPQFHSYHEREKAKSEVRTAFAEAVRFHAARDNFDPTKFPVDPNLAEPVTSGAEYTDVPAAPPDTDFKFYANQIAVHHRQTLREDQKASIAKVVAAIINRPAEPQPTTYTIKIDCGADNPTEQQVDAIQRAAKLVMADKAGIYTAIGTMGWEFTVRGGKAKPTVDQIILIRGIAARILAGECDATFEPIDFPIGTSMRIAFLRHLSDAERRDIVTAAMGVVGSNQIQSVSSSSGSDGKKEPKPTADIIGPLLAEYAKSKDLDPSKYPYQEIIDEHHARLKAKDEKPTVFDRDCRDYVQRIFRESEQHNWGNLIAKIRIAIRDEFHSLTTKNPVNQTEAPQGEMFDHEAQ